MSSGNPPAPRKYELKARAEAQAETRRRIVQATMELHQEVGPAKTTVAEIARRAGVQRLTVYKHFPEEAELFAACQGMFLSHHPLPDYGSLLAEADPVLAVLRALYRSYRERSPMTSKVLRDRSVLPALDGLLSATMDASMVHLGEALAAPFEARGQKGTRLRAMIAVALDFWTWHRLQSSGLSDHEAADVMAEAITCVAA